jgi:hypothetical protein
MIYIWTLTYHHGVTLCQTCNCLSIRLKDWSKVNASNNLCEISLQLLMRSLYIMTPISWWMDGWMDGYPSLHLIDEESRQIFILWKFLHSLYIYIMFPPLFFFIEKFFIFYFSFYDGGQGYIQWPYRIIYSTRSTK